MLAIPVIELRNGEVAGLPPDGLGNEATLPRDAASLAMRWATAGFPLLHVADLDAGPQTSPNRRLVERILNSAGVPVQLDCAIRDDDSAASWISAGVQRIVVGTRAIEDPAWFRSLTERHADRAVVSVQVREGHIVTYGWKRGGGMAPEELFARLDLLAIAAVLITDLEREERGGGVNDALFEGLTRACRHPLIASGGISTVEDLRRLAERGVPAALVGKPLYGGEIDPIPLAREFSGEVVR